MPFLRSDCALSRDRRRPPRSGYPWPRPFRHIGSRLDAENGYSSRFEVLQQIAVVARHFDDERVWTECEARRSGLHIVFCVPQPAFGEGRRIDVVAEHRLWALERGELDQVAGFADIGAERIERLHPSACSGDTNEFAIGVMPTSAKVVCSAAPQQRHERMAPIAEGVLVSRLDGLSCFIGPPVEVFRLKWDANYAERPRQISTGAPAFSLEMRGVPSAAHRNCADAMTVRATCGPEV